VEAKAFGVLVGQSVALRTSSVKCVADALSGHEDDHRRISPKASTPYSSALSAWKPPCSGSLSRLASGSLRTTPLKSTLHYNGA